MRRLLLGATALIPLLIILNGCSNDAGQAPTADEAARQSAITQQGAVNAPQPGVAPGGSPSSTPGH